MINEQDAVEMINLVAEASGQKPFRHVLHRMPLRSCPRQRPLWTNNGITEFRNAQTTFLVLLLALRRNDLRIADYDELFLVLSA